MVTYEVCPYHSKVQSDPNLAKLTFFTGDVLVNLNSRKITVSRVHTFYASDET